MFRQRCQPGPDNRFCDVRSKGKRWVADFELPGSGNDCAFFCTGFMELDVAVCLDGFLDIFDVSRGGSDEVANLSVLAAYFPNDGSPWRQYREIRENLPHGFCFVWPHPYYFLKDKVFYLMLQ